MMDQAQKMQLLTDFFLLDNRALKSLRAFLRDNLLSEILFLELEKEKGGNPEVNKKLEHFIETKKSHFTLKYVSYI